MLFCVQKPKYYATSEIFAQPLGGTAVLFRNSGPDVFIIFCNVLYIVYRFKHNFSLLGHLKKNSWSSKRGINEIQIMNKYFVATSPWKNSAISDNTFPVNSRGYSTLNTIHITHHTIQITYHTPNIQHHTSHST